MVALEGELRQMSIPGLSPSRLLLCVVDPDFVACWDYENGCMDSVRDLSFFDLDFSVFEHEAFLYDRQMGRILDTGSLAVMYDRCSLWVDIFNIPF